MTRTFLASCGVLCAGLLPFAVATATPVIWDNQNGNGIWNDPVNWGILNNPGYNVAPVAGDTVIFRSSSAAGTITLTNHGFCARFRQDAGAVNRTVTIHPGQTADRVLTLDGTAAELFDFRAANSSFTFDGAPNGNGAKLKLVLNGKNSACAINSDATLTLSCDVSGTNGITLNEGDNGGGTLVLNGANTYTGPTTVDAGLLKLNGKSSPGAVMVNSGALWGQGTIAGQVIVAGGAKVAAGFSAGQLTLGAGLDMSATVNDPVNVWELAAFKDDATGVAGTDFDQIVLTGGTLALGTESVLEVRFIGSTTPPGAGDPFWQSAHTWTVIRLNGGTNPGLSKFGLVKSGRSCAGTFTTAATPNGIVLTFTPLPPLAAPRIVTLSGAGLDSVTVNYTNTLPGMSYVLSYSTNLYLTNWFSAGIKAAAGTGDSQTDNSATGNQRYYRVHHVEPLTLNIMTYNIKAARHHALTMTVLQELENIAQVIERNQPEVLMLQEVMRFDPYVNYVDEFAWLQQRLGYPHGYFASGQQDPVLPGTAEWGVAIYLRNGQITSTKKHLLGYNRVLFRVNAFIGGTNVAFYCTHLGSGAVAEQAGLVGQILATNMPPQPIILGGDFNATPQSNELSPIRTILENIFVGYEEQPGDSFFVSADVGVVCAQVVVDPTKSSDHDPVISLVKIPADPPGTPTAKAATSVTDTSFTANWNNASGATGYRLDVSTNNAFATFVSGYNNLDAGAALNRGVSGLIGTTTYYYRVRAYNGVGTSGNSGTISVTTAPSPPAPPVTKAASGVTSNGFTANWSSAVDATGYRLDVSKTNTFSSFLSGYNNLDLGNVLSREVTGLTTGATYFYRVRAYNGAGTSGNSSTVAVTLETADPCITIANPNFESGFMLAGGGYLATNWTEWETDPAVVVGYDETAILHSGAHAQRVRVWGGTNGSSGGIYQQVPVVAGQPFMVGAWIYAGDDLTTAYLGVDPAGGTNANSAGVTWSSGTTNVAWVHKTLTETATANSITLFLKALTTDNAKRNVYFDDAIPDSCGDGPSDSKQ